jgi:hypothetical protein
MDLNKDSLLKRSPKPSVKIALLFLRKFEITSYTSKLEVMEDHIIHAQKNFIVIYVSSVILALQSARHHSANTVANVTKTVNTLSIMSVHNSSDRRMYAMAVLQETDAERRKDSMSLRRLTKSTL